MGLQFSVESSTAVRNGDNVVVERASLSSGTNHSATSSSRAVKRGENVMVQQHTWSHHNGHSQSATATARMAPGGVTHIQTQVSDGRGHERLVSERRVGESARRVEKVFDRRTGEEETYDNTYGIADGRELEFDHEFERRMRGEQPRPLAGGESHTGAGAGGGGEGGGGRFIQN